MREDLRSRARQLGPWLAVAAVGVLATGLLRWEGRRWWCACGEPWPWASDVWSSHCSQHLFDQDLVVQRMVIAPSATS